MLRFSAFAFLSLALSSVCLSADTPRPVPLTRPEMKQFLEDMKARPPRIPLPELTEADRTALGERADQYESRLRYHYLPGGQAAARAPGGGVGAPGFGSFSGFGFSREPDPKMTLDYAFKTQLFWIVSRTNNCQYCLGHQESKLLAAGLTEDEIAALDGDWLSHSAKEQAAFAFARKLTHEPHLIDDADVVRLKKHFTELQILEMVLSVSGNNAINRWKEGAGIPQSHNGGNFGSRRPGETAPKPEANAAPHSYLTPTAEKNQKSISQMAVVLFGDTKGATVRLPVFRRAALENREAAMKSLTANAQRQPRLPVLDEAAAREVVKDVWPESAGSLPGWVRLLANFPRDGKSRVQSQLAAETQGDLSPLVKAQVSWIVARQDRAWYAADRARQQLLGLKQSDDRIFALDGDWSEFTPAEQAQFRLAAKLSATPVMLTDADVAAAVKEIGPRQTTQLISYVTTCASFNRITLAAGIPSDRE